MRKLLSVIFFAAALTWTWSLIHSSPSVGFETHSGIQEKLVTFIMNYMQSKRINATDLNMTRLWTETIGENKVRAVFALRFKEPAEGNEMVDQTLEGEAVLHREPTNDPETDRWVIQSMQTKSDSMSFQEGLIVTPVPAEGEEQDPTAPPAGESKGG